MRPLAAPQREWGQITAHGRGGHVWILCGPPSQPRLAVQHDVPWPIGAAQFALSRLAADLFRLQVAVIVAARPTAAVAAKAATTTIPIVFSIAGDPANLGLVASLARPGENLSGTTRLNLEAVAKRFQLLHEMVPAGISFALLVNAANNVLAEPVTRDAKAAAGVAARNSSRTSNKG